MKKYIILIIYHCVFLEIMKAQQLQGKAMAPLSGKRNIEKMTTVDSCNMRFSYALNAEDITNIDSYVDLQRLEIGRHFSKYYSFFIFNNDSLVWIWKNKKQAAQSIPSWLGPLGKGKYYWSEYKYSEFFKDYQNNTITEYARMPYGIMNNRLYSEKTPEQNWTIHNDTSTIIGHLCQKATCYFRGRNYTAWFALDIPICNGPWKFGGLPGIILKVYDDKQLYTFECVKIESGIFPIKKYNFTSYNPIEREKLLKLQRKLNEDYYRTIGARRRDGGKLPDPVPYEPIELE
uniref:GLPGLI family protein n=1 Tax=Bacteroides cellulosilyticus TaxID=246787 RepID=UPI0040278C0D